MTKKVATTKGFKAFDKGLVCRGFQYEEGKEYIAEGSLEMCRNGFHFCENPLDTLRFYNLTTSEFAEVEALGDVEKAEDGKAVTNHLKVGVKLDLSAFVKAAVEFVWTKASEKKIFKKGNATSGDRAHSATSGNDANSATSGEYAHSATSGYGANSATSGYGAHSATSGYGANSATSGYGANSATSGDRAHSATSGNDANSATSGEYAHSATSGDRANSATSGYGANSATSGNDAIACAVGRKASAKGSLGCWIVVAEWKEGSNFTDAKPVDVKAVQVDGKKIKVDTFYKIEGGKFVETGE